MEGNWRAAAAAEEGKEAKREIERLPGCPAQEVYEDDRQTRKHSDRWLLGRNHLRLPYFKPGCAFHVAKRLFQRGDHPAAEEGKGGSGEGKSGRGGGRRGGADDPDTGTRDLPARSPPSTTIWYTPKGKSPEEDEEEKVGPVPQAKLHLFGVPGAEAG